MILLILLSPSAGIRPLLNISVPLKTPKRPAIIVRGMEGGKGYADSVRRRRCLVALLRLLDSSLCHLTFYDAQRDEKRGDILAQTCYNFKTLNRVDTVLFQQSVIYVYMYDHATSKLYVLLVRAKSAFRNIPK